MRDPNRIFPFAVRLGVSWSKMPDQRFGQLMTNFFLWLEKQNLDPFYLEDAELFKQFESYVAIFTGTE